MVGAGAGAPEGLGAPAAPIEAVLRGIVGAGAGGLGAVGAVGAEEAAAVGGLGAVGAVGVAAVGGLGGLDALAVGAGGAGFPAGVGSALSVTRTVSFLIGTAEVFFIGAGGLGGCFSSLMVGV